MKILAHMTIPVTIIFQRLLKIKIYKIFQSKFNQLNKSLLKQILIKRKDYLN